MRGWGWNLGAADLGQVSPSHWGKKKKNGDRFTNLIGFKLEEVNTCVKEPDAQEDPNLFIIYLFIY